MANNIIRWFYEKNIPKTPRKRSISGINPQKRIAVLFDGTSEEDRKTVHAFKKQLKQSGATNVSSLAFVNNKLPLDNVDYAAYNLKNVNWYGVPSGQKVEEFLKVPWDLVIFLGDKMNLHFEYLLSYVDASFIIGNYVNGANDLFDLTIDTEKEVNLSQKINSIIKGIELISINKIIK